MALDLVGDNPMSDSPWGSFADMMADADYLHHSAIRSCGLSGRGGMLRSLKIRHEMFGGARGAMQVAYSWGRGIGGDGGMQMGLS